VIDKREKRVSEKKLFNFSVILSLSLSPQHSPFSVKGLKS
jgi:hypothetical protein